MSATWGPDLTPEFSGLDEPPVRLCCGQRHWTVQCPDGKVMCQLCFGRFEISELYVDPEDGRPVDVCIDCARHEQEKPHG